MTKSDLQAAFARAMEAREAAGREMRCFFGGGPTIEKQLAFAANDAAAAMVFIGELIEQLPGDDQ